MPIKITEEAGVRYLQFGAHWVQGAMRLSRPWSLELEYARDMMFPLLLRPTAWPRRVLTIGLGAGALAKFLYRYRPASKIDVVEIDPEVVLSAYAFFDLPHDPSRLSIAIDDGYRFVARTHQRYDLIQLDGFDAKVEAGDLDSIPFYRHCLSRLKPNGLLAVNLVSRRGRPRESIARLAQVFEGRVLVLPPNEANTVVLASAEPPPRLGWTQLERAAGALKAKTGLELGRTLNSMRRRK